MWETKISFDGTKKNVLAGYAKKNNVRVLIFPLSWAYEKSGVVVNSAGVLFGDGKSKRGFIRDWKKGGESRLLDIDLNGDFFVGVVKEYPDAKMIFNKNIIFTKPFLIDENGFEVIVVDSFEKKYLEDFIGVMDKFHGIKIHYIKKVKVKDISFRSVAPDLTEKQKGAMELAVRSGYYNYPRKISVKKLAKDSKLGFTTFHSHLRKAEQKMMPFFSRVE